MSGNIWGCQTGVETLASKDRDAANILQGTAQPPTAENQGTQDISRAAILHPVSELTR